MAIIDKPNFRGFKLYRHKPNKIEFGYLYTKKIIIECASEKERILYVWIPENYSKCKKYRAIYMLDGQNAVDHYLSAYGEWNLEVHLNNLTKRGFPPCIIVGIACPIKIEERCKEYSPFDPDFQTDLNYCNSYGNKFLEYLIKDIKPLIEKRFNVYKNKSIILGSSMGGLFSLYASLQHPKEFPNCISYSPAVHMYKDETIKECLMKVNVKNYSKPNIALYMGGGDSLEIKLSSKYFYIVDILNENGFDNNCLHVLFEPSLNHSENSWSEKIEESLSFLLSRK